MSLTTLNLMILCRTIGPGPILIKISHIIDKISHINVYYFSEKNNPNFRENPSKLTIRLTLSWKNIR